MSPEETMPLTELSTGQEELSKGVDRDGRPARRRVSIPAGT